MSSGWARNRDDGVTLEQVAADFGIYPMTLSNWMCEPGERRTDGFRCPCVIDSHRAMSC